MPTKQGAKISDSFMSLRPRLREYPRNGTIPCGNQRTLNAFEIRQESKGSASCGIYRRGIRRVQPTRCKVSRCIYFCKTLYMFQTGFPSIIKSSKLHIQRQVPLLHAASLASST